MPNNINVTVELSAEDRARLDKIIDSLSELFISEKIEVNATTEVEVTAPEPVEDEPKPEPTVTIDEVRLLVQKLATPSSGKRDAVRTIVMKYAKSVSDIPADKLNEVHAELVALDKGA